MLASLLAAAQPALAIKHLSVAPIPSPGPNRLETPVATLEAQPKGLVAALLRMLKLGKTTTLQLTTQRIIRLDRSPSSQTTSTFPLSRVASIQYGHTKPVALMALGVLLALSGLVSLVVAGAAALLPLLVGAGLIASYFFSGLSFTMIFASVAGSAIVLKLKCTDPAQLTQMCESAHALLKAAEAPQALSGTAPAVPPPFAARA
jgi:hypothetical protein